MYGKSEDSRDYQDLSCPVAVMAVDYANGSYEPPHRHRRAQVVYSSSGVMTVGTEQGLWVVPTHRGLWMPAGVEHWIRMVGRVRMRTAYIAPEAVGGLPGSPSIVEVSPLFRELLLRAASLPAQYLAESHEARVAALILDEIKAMPMIALHLPTPSDRRAAKVCEAIRADPSQDLTLEQWGRRVGASGRPLARLFVRDAGMTFAVWRQQARLLSALERLGRGESVLQVALSAGYDSPSAFSAMFRRSLGITPSAYFRSKG